MHVRHLSVGDFRSYTSAELPLGPGISTIVGLNGQGKTNLVEAIGYLATLSSHRVATDAPLVRFGAQQAVVRGAVVRDGRETLVELEINPGRANRARLNKSPLTRPRDVLGTLRTVLFAPEDLALVKGDPGERRRFLDELLVARQPRWAGVRSDYDKIVKQRGALLKSAQPYLGRNARRRRAVHRGRRRRGRAGVGPDDPRGVGRPPRPGRLPAALRAAAAAARPGPYLVEGLRRGQRGPVRRPGVVQGVPARGDGRPPGRRRGPRGRPSCTTRSSPRWPRSARRRSSGGSASSGRTATTWSSPSASCRPRATRATGSRGRSRSASSSRRSSCCAPTSATTPSSSSTTSSPSSTPGRRERLAAMVADCEQVLITAAVPADVPAGLAGRTYAVTLGEVSRGCRTSAG